VTDKAFYLESLLKYYEDEVMGSVNPTRGEHEGSTYVSLASTWF
jgi:hypothetical protein